MAYEYCQELTANFDERLTKKEAINKIKKWKRRLQKSDPTCFDDFLTTLDNHRNDIVNSFEGRFNGCVVEGLKIRSRLLRGIAMVSSTWNTLSSASTSILWVIHYSFHSWIRFKQLELPKNQELRLSKIGKSSDLDPRKVSCKIPSLFVNQFQTLFFF